MPQKRGEVIEKVDATQAVPDIYEDWLTKQVKARSKSFASQATEDEEEDEVDAAEELHEKAHRRKRGKGAAAGGS
ncbi:MAG TPA: hypothetical protein VND40_00705 [Nitrososphaerales archaeon]|nr:hypothetical protein [Nitrososphaerales archaeon]